MAVLLPQFIRYLYNNLPMLFIQHRAVQKLLHKIPTFHFLNLLQHFDRLFKYYVVDYLSTANRDILVTEDGSFTQRYVYDDNSTRISAEYGYAAGTKRGEGGENLQSDFATNDVRKVWYRASHLGSTLFAVDENGKVISHTIYDPWGNPLAETYTDANFSGIDNANNFTGYTWDEVLDLYFAQNRFYDPADHRFTQEDPIKDGENWYGYCGDNPVLSMDYTGLTYVQLRPLAQKYGGKVTWEKATRRTPARAKVTFNNISKYYTATNQDSDKARMGTKNSSAYNYKGNTMYVDDAHFYAQWGLIHNKQTLLDSLTTSVDNYKTIPQTIGTAFYNSTEDAMNTVLNYNQTIECTAKKYGIEKAIIQSILFGSIPNSV